MANSLLVHKLRSGNILVEYESEQLTPMQGPGTEGVVSFEVHPCQKHQYEYWSNQLSEKDQQCEGPGCDGAEPWWSLRKARTDNATESTLQMLSKTRNRGDAKRNEPKTSRDENDS